MLLIRINSEDGVVRRVKRKRVYDVDFPENNEESEAEPYWFPQQRTALLAGVFVLDVLSCAELHEQMLLKASDSDASNTDGLLRASIRRSCKYKAEALELLHALNGTFFFMPGTDHHRYCSEIDNGRDIIITDSSAHMFAASLARQICNLGN